MEWIITNLVPLGLGGILGTVFSQIIAAIREKAARRTAFRKQQLEQFYGPLLAMHKEIRGRSELRVKLQNAIDSKHMNDLMRSEAKELADVTAGYLPAVIASVQDETATFKDILMPRYREMIDVFRDKMWLAEPRTRKFFGDLIEFVDVWDKILARKFPREIALAIGHTEENLRPFYLHLEEVHDRLRSEAS